jgi:hypothetical protein
MSLARLAMRIAAARALKGATLAGDRVFDSAIDPIDQTVAENRQPILVVMTDDHEADLTGRDLIRGDAGCELVIEAAIAARVEIPATDGDGNSTTIAIPHTDEGMELVLDLIEHQVLAALTRERSDWSRVWMKLVPRTARRLSRRGASAENGVRFAARQIVITCDLVEPPAAGAKIESGTAWDDLMTVMSADEALAPVASMLRAEIEGEPLSDWQRAANVLGITLETAEGLGIGQTLDETGNPVELADIVLEPDSGAAIPVADHA